MARQYHLQTTEGKSGSGVDYASELNEEQYRAVSSPPGKTLVIAGAGSGKTRTLTYRVGWLLDHGVGAHEILLLTFTNKASKEMIARVKGLVQDDISAMWAGTFHSIGSRILRRHAKDLGYDSSFSIMDRDDQKSLLSRVIKDSKIDTKQRRFPKADVLVSVISLCENTTGDIRETIKYEYSSLYEWVDEIATVYEGYLVRKLASNSMDFDDLLVLTVRLFEKYPDVLEVYQRRFKHVLVDEYQDTNRVQARLIDLLIGGGSSLMAVGDDSQSIYSWRGADISLILGFQQRYLGSRVITIETNYRSVPEILELSNSAIRVNQGRYEKDLRASRASEGVKPALVPLPCPRTQAQFVVQRMKELHEEGIAYKDMAVLYRAHFQSMEVQMEMTAKKMDFSITSGLRFFEQAHVKDVTAFIRFVVNRKDRVSFERMVGLLPGCGVSTMEKLWQEWEKSGWMESEVPPSSWVEVMKFKVPKRAEVHWRQLCFILDEMCRDGKYAKPSEMIFSILEGMYDDYLLNSYDNSDLRRGDIERLSEFSSSFDEVGEFLEQLSLLGNADTQAQEAKPSGELDKVTLTSIHQAKGLEWKVVFIIWLVEGQFPNRKIIESFDLKAFEEERRLFYVALTRAKDHLYLTYPMTHPKSYTGEYFCHPSSFLDDCQSEWIEEWQVFEGGNASTSWGNNWEEDEPF